MKTLNYHVRSPYPRYQYCLVNMPYVKERKPTFGSVDKQHLWKVGDNHWTWGRNTCRYHSARYTPSLKSFGDNLLALNLLAVVLSERVVSA